MHAFALATGLDDGATERLAGAVEDLGAEFRLDPGTFWRVRSATGALCAAGVHHGDVAAGARRYRLLAPDRAVLFDGLPVDIEGGFAGHDAAALDAHWEALPARLEGQFCAVRIDLAGERAEILCDPLGIVPVFFGRRRGAAVAASSAGLVAAVLGIEEVDPLAVASFVALGWAVQRRSFRAGVSALPGGGVHRLDASGRVRSDVHFGAAAVAARRPSPAPAPVPATALVRLASGAASAGGPVRCALTAGHDTRVLAALLRRAGVPAGYYTSGATSSADVVIARELAARLRLSHELLDAGVPGLDWTAAATRFVRQNDGLASLVQLPDYIELAAPAAALGVTFWGVGGEIGRAGTGAISNLAPNLPLLSRSLTVQRRLLALKVDDGGLLTASGRALVTGYLDRFIAERRAEGWPARELSEAFYAFERVASWGATGPRRAAGTGDLFSPFCTRPFVEYCFSLRPAERYLEQPHHRLIAACAPELLDHRFEHPFPPQHKVLAGPLALRQLAGVLRTRRRHGGGGASAAGGRPPFLDGWLEARTGLIAELVERAPGSLWELVDRRRLHGLLAGDASARASHRDTLLRIATPLWELTGGPGER